MNHRSPPKRPLNAEIISIGDEMISGARLDTNAQWLSRRLAELGVAVTFHSTVGDTLQHNIDVFRLAAQRADVVVSTGGLGATRDDLTREALGGVVGRELEFRESAMAHIQNLFTRRNRDMPARNRAQAMFPVGSEEIFNSQGTAPGIDMAVPRDKGASPVSRIYALPGVPAEMKRMFDDIVAPRILQQSDARIQIRQLVMKFFGTGESEMERRLGTMLARHRQPRVGITVNAATLSLRITATGNNDRDCHALIEENRAEILELVSEFHFGDGEECEQYHVIAERLRERQESLLVLEFGSAALLGNWFSSLGESSAYRGGFSLSVVDDLKRMFNTTKEADALAQAAKSVGADWILMVDGYPAIEPDNDAPLPASDIRLVVVSPDNVVHATHPKVGGHPDVLHPRIAKSAMAWMRKILRAHAEDVNVGQHSGD